MKRYNTDTEEIMTNLTNKAMTPRLRSETGTPFRKEHATGSGNSQPGVPRAFALWSRIHSGGKHSTRTGRQWLSGVALAALVAAASVVMVPAEASARQMPPPPDLPMKPQQTPIDGGLALLAAAGGGYAIKKLRDKRK